LLVLSWCLALQRKQDREVCNEEHIGGVQTDSRPVFAQVPNYTCAKSQTKSIKPIKLNCGVDSKASYENMHQLEAVKHVTHTRSDAVEFWKIVLHLRGVGP